MDRNSIFAFSYLLTQIIIITLWASSHLFHIGWLNNYRSFIRSSIHGESTKTLLSAHAIRYPHFGIASGLDQWYLSVDITSESQLFHSASFRCVLGGIFLVAGLFHGLVDLSNNYLTVTSFKARLWQSSLNHNLTCMAVNIAHVAVTVSRGVSANGLVILNQLCHHLSFILSLLFIVGVIPAYDSLALTDITHHHLAIVAGAIINGLSFSSLWNQPESLHYQLALSLAFLGIASSFTVQLYKVSHAGLYNQYLGGLFICGAFAHSAIYLVRDDSYNTSIGIGNTLPCEQIIMDYVVTLSTYLMGWLKDYLRFNSSQLMVLLIFIVNSLSVWLRINSNVWAHEQTPIATRWIWNEKPVALSIVQARFGCT